jgi:hypothetical protein
MIQRLAKRPEKGTQDAPRAQAACAGAKEGLIHAPTDDQAVVFSSY